jgi:tetrapyrrole methylase family protein/MazG family protein
VNVRDAGEVLRNWEAIKRQEARDRVTDAATQAGSDRRRADKALASSFDGVPAILPALARAQSLGERAARHGFDWPDVAGVLDKLSEEVGELRAAEDLETRASEFGDLLFTLVNVARWLAVDAEDVLRGACDRFVRRYAEMEQIARARGLDLADLTLADKDQLWVAAKAVVE